MNTIKSGKSILHQLETNRWRISVDFSVVFQGKLWSFTFQDNNFLSDVSTSRFQLSDRNMWLRSSKKTYVLNRSCMDLFSSPSKDQENPFCFSIPVTYFNFLDNEKGEKFYSSLIFTYSELELLGHCLQMCLSEAIVGWMLVIGPSWNIWVTIFL